MLHRDKHCMLLVGRPKNEQEYGLRAVSSIQALGRHRIGMDASSANPRIPTADNFLINAVAADTDVWSPVAEQRTTRADHTIKYGMNHMMLAWVSMCGHLQTRTIRQLRAGTTCLQLATRQAHLYRLKRELGELGLLWCTCMD